MLQIVNLCGGKKISEREKRKANLSREETTSTEETDNDKKTSVQVL